MLSVYDSFSPKAIASAIAYWHAQGVHLDVGKSCGPRSQPCGESCIPRRRGKTVLKCRKATSGIATQANQKNRAKEIDRLKGLRDEARAKRQRKRSRKQASDFVASRGFTGGSRVEKLRKMEEGRYFNRMNQLAKKEAEGRPVERKSTPQRSPTDKVAANRKFRPQGPTNRVVRKTSRGGTTIGGISIDSREDSNPTPARKVVSIAGLPIGITHGRGEFLPGETSPLGTPYGWVQGHSGVGNRTLKTYIGPKVNSDRVFTLMVLDEAGQVSRARLIVGVDSETEALAIARAHVPMDLIGPLSEFRIDGSPCGQGFKKLRRSLEVASA